MLLQIKDFSELKCCNYFKFYILSRVILKSFLSRVFTMCNSQLEGALSQWTSYQEDVGQFVLWMDRVEETLSCSDRQYAEMRDKTANLGKTKVSDTV